MARNEGPNGRDKPAPSLAMAAAIVAAGFLGSRILGLLRSVIIAHSYGASGELDAYWVAFRLPDLVFQLLAGATLASAFIPTFAAAWQRDGSAAAWRLASSVLNLIVVATTIFAAVAFVFAPSIVPLLAPGLGEASGRERELQDLAVSLTRVMLLSPLLFAASGMFMGILNARRHFLAPSLAPMFYNLAIIAAALLSRDVRVLAVGVVAGAALHLAVQLPDLRRAGMAYSLVADWRDVAVRRVGGLMGPRVLGLAATQVNFYFITIFFASRLDEGAISSLSFAWLITMTPLGVIGMAISTAAFPTMADQAARADGALSRTLAGALRLILYLSLPAGVGLALLAKPLVIVLLQHGAFDPSAARITAGALVFYALALFAHGGIEILSRGFYALGDTRTPVAIAACGMLINLVLAAILVGPLELAGLAIALSLATTVEVGLLFVVVARRIDGLAGKSLLGFAARILLGAALMAVGVSLPLILLGGFEPASTSTAVIALIGGAGVGAAVYFIATLLLGCEEPRLLWSRVSGLARRSPA